MKEYINGTVTAVGTGLTWMFGSWDIALKVLALFIVVDYITGVISAVIEKKLNSNVGFKGIARKGLIFLILIVGVALDKLLNQGNFLIRTIICYFYIANEGISIIENSVKLGLPVPKKLIDTLQQLREKDNKSNDKDGM